MVRFITTAEEQPSVETMMSYVNDLINFNDMSNVSDNTQFYTIRREYGELMRTAEELQHYYAISAENAIGVGGRFMKAKLFVKKCIRKCLKWYMKDLAVQQTEFNARLLRCVNQQVMIIQKMDMELSRMSKEIRQLKTPERLTAGEEENQKAEEA